MVKVFICYDSKYGNTKLCAEKVAEGIRSDRTEVDLGYIKEINPKSVMDYDVIVLGAPNHMGRPSQAMKNFINSLALFDLKDKKIAIFGTYAGKERVLDRAVKKMNTMVQDKMPNLSLVLPSLSVRVHGVSGPVFDGELPKCMDFGKNLTAHL